MKNTVDNLSKSKVILMCGPAGAGKSTLAKKFESTGMTILSYDEESFKRGFNEHPLPQEVLEDIKTYLDEKLISLSQRFRKPRNRVLRCRKRCIPPHRIRSSHSPPGTGI